jgi:hypothetical protein
LGVCSYSCGDCDTKHTLSWCGSIDSGTMMTVDDCTTFSCFFLIPFFSCSKKATMVREHRLRPSLPEGSDPLLVHLVEACSGFEVTDRPSFNQICDVLKDRVWSIACAFDVQSTLPELYF